jgi:hypothetical protein
MAENDEIPDEIPELDGDTITKRVKLSHDGRQLMLRFPREITEFYNLKKGDHIELVVKIPPNMGSVREIPMQVKVEEAKP